MTIAELISIANSRPVGEEEVAALRKGAIAAAAESEAEVKARSVSAEDLARTYSL